MSTPFSYRHLYYFWVVAQAGGMARAAARLDMAVQTVSSQVRELERALGVALLKPAGRGLQLTEAGLAALHQADQIFALGEQLPALVRGAAAASGLRLVVGVSDGLPKLVVRRLLEPVLAAPGLRLVCHDGEFDDLLADLARHRMDVLLADRPAPVNPNLKVYSHALGASPLAWFGAPGLLSGLVGAPSARPADGGQAAALQALQQLPVLLPTPHAVVRLALDHWFQRHGIVPRIAGEVEDSALLKTFGASGMGLFPAAELVQDELIAAYGVQRIGPCDGVQQQFFAVGTQKRVSHPLVRLLLPDRH